MDKLRIITEEVECGHFRDTGGTADISITLKNPPKDINVNDYLDIMDSLDHCLITSSKEPIQFSQRYFLLSESTSFLDDVVGIITILLKQYYNDNNKDWDVMSVNAICGKETALYTYITEPGDYEFGFVIVEKNTKG